MRILEHRRMTKRPEPEALRHGKLFHKRIQEEWLATVKDGTPRPERYIKRLSGSVGRVDILVEELGDDLVSVVEIKASDWDAMAQRNVIRNAKRQIRQIWSYVEAELELYRRQVCPGIIFPKMPRKPTRLELIESLFNDEGIQVVWQDESLEHLRRRTAGKAEPPPS